MATEIIIIDDHPFILEGLKSMLDLQNEYLVSKMFSNGSESLCFLQENKNIEIVITDINMPEMNGIELCQNIKKLNRDIKVLMLSMYDNESIVHMSLDAEADGYILKNSGKSQLITALDKILSGGTYYDKKIVPIIQDRLKKERWIANKENHILTAREKEILQLILKEFTSEEIAKALFISKKTVDNHRYHIMEKTGCKSTIGLVKFALNMGLINE